MGTLKFSGHESFQCRNLWLKKGYDFLTQPEDKRKNFNDDLAVIDLGVGKNMVSSIRFWMKAFGIIDLENERPTWLAEYLFGENGWDLFFRRFGYTLAAAFSFSKAKRSKYLFLAIQ
jgi:hypothetical protein